jgi:hypothetical protein
MSQVFMVDEWWMVGWVKSGVSASEGAAEVRAAYFVTGASEMFGPAVFELGDGLGLVNDGCFSGVGIGKLKLDHAD